ncbi:MAG: GrpB family protein [Bacteroidota bacterium]
MKIEIHPYNPAWPQLFAEEKQRLSAQLDGLGARIEHIGSTSVPDLAAKPIIDIAVGLQSPDHLDQMPDRMLQDPHYLYFPVYESMMPGRRYFLRISSAGQRAQLPQVIDNFELTLHPAVLTREYQIHIWVEATEDYQRHLRFRDHLRTHPQVRQAYEDLKKDLAQREWASGGDYAEAKTEFIRRIEREALGGAG